MPGQDVTKRRTVDQALEVSGRLAADRMVDEHDPEDAFPIELQQYRGHSSKLLATEKAGRPERRRRGGGRQADQSQRAATPYERKARLAGVASHVRAPMEL